MKEVTRRLFNEMIDQVAAVNHVSDVSKKFALDPAVEQIIVETMGHDSSFLEKINIVPVSESKGQHLGLGVGQPIASRTNTKTGERETAYVGDLNGDKYECVQTNFDTHIDYRTLDTWASINDFGERYKKAVLKRRALDSIMVGWNGEQAAANTDRSAYPLLQDVNIGWFEKVRLYEPKRLLGYGSDGLENEDVIQVGEGGSYGTLDALVFDVVSNMLDPWHQDGDDLVLILGRELWVNHGLTLYSETRSPSEKNALETWFARQAVGGLLTLNVPFFPKRGLVVTSLDNLSIYFQSGSVRRAIVENPKRDRIEEYLSSNDAFIVEDFGKFAGVRSGAIKIKNHLGEWV